MFYFVRGSVVAQVEVSRPRHCVDYSDLELLPREAVQQADFVFKINKDNTVTFIKKRSDGENKNFFNIDFAITHMQQYYNQGMYFNFDLTSFRIVDLTDYRDPSDFRDKVAHLAQLLREGVK